MKKYLLVFFVLTLSPLLFAQQPSIPLPADILGYNLGDRFTSHGTIEQYIHAVADAATDRVRVVKYGETYEGRALYLVIVSSPENMGRLEEIKTNIRRLADPRTTGATEAASIIRSTPAIAWLSYGVHGNEASSPEAALNVLYQLVSRTDDTIKTLLKNLVIVIDPLLNPDGHERYVNYQITRSGRKPREEKSAAEHNEEWPSGRTNHYYFDLNRDWAWLTQKETQARIKAYQEWKPQVHVDFHEMSYNSSYFFFPAFKPINKNYPKSTLDWGAIYGKGNAAAFDATGQSYWSGESFDLFYPGYGDSWPSLNGAIGMTYEQAGQVGVRVKRSDENILTLFERLTNHSLTSLATLKTTSENREKRLRDFYEFFRDAIEEGKNGPVRTFLLNPTRDASGAAKLVSLLLQQGIEVEQTTQSVSADGLSTYFTKGTVASKFPAGSYLVKLDQPAKRLIMALLEQEPLLTDTVFYDISTWSLPVAYGADAYWTGKSINVPTQKIATVSLPPGEVVGGQATYAYLLRWNSNDAIRAAAQLLQEGYRVQVAMREFTVSKERYQRGTVIVPVRGNSSAMHNRIQQLADEFHLRWFAANSGFTESGINLGSDRAVVLKKPKIIVVTGSPVGTGSFGAIWSMFDEQYGIDFVPMKLAQLRSVDLHPYTTIIFPDDYANGNGYRNQIDSAFAEKIKTWVAGGGTFIGIEGGAAFASKSHIADVKIKKKKDDKKEDKDDKKKELTEEELEMRMTVEERERKSRLEEIPGTMLRVKLDTSHPLGFGYETSSLAVFKSSTNVFELSESGYNVAIYSKSPRLSGYLSDQNAKKIEETPYLVHETVGSGNVVLFVDDPNFRLFWEGLNKLFLNSVLVLPSVRSVSMAAEGNE